MRETFAARVCSLAILGFVALTGAGALHAKAFIPERDDVVLERLPEKLPLLYFRLAG